MPKQKAPTPQEIYWARKQREEQERDALLPPGLINHGNTCFMNSVLQGLIATRLLSDLVQFRPLAPSVQLLSSTPMVSWRSPQLTNGHGLGGEHEQEWVEGMPLGDTFVAVMLRAWTIQRDKRRESMSPKDILAALGRKYDQYFDFRQQDAHEFLRLLLDAMRMEEQDIIKKRQPPPPPEKHKRPRKPFIPPALPEEERLISFADMLFGGRLTSVLVCQKCKHISFTYEDFNDLSLSIKPEDYARERKRDRLKSFARRLTRLPTTLGAGAMEIQRSSSVPASPRASMMDLAHHEHSMDEPRRRSVDYVAADAQGETGLPGGSDEMHDTLGDKPRSGEHVEFAEQAKAERKDKKDDDGWTRFGRRISIGLGMRDDRRKSRSREKVQKIAEEPEIPKTKEKEESILSKDSSSSTDNVSPRNGFQGDRHYLPTSVSEEAIKKPEGNDIGPLSPATAPLPSTPRFPNIYRSSSPGKRPRLPRPPKPSADEAAFLRRILADITPASSNPFALFKPPSHGDVTPSSAAQLFMKMGSLSGVEECLRMFTAVEILDGENMVGCRRCWKIEHGEYNHHTRAKETYFDGTDSDEDDKHNKEHHMENGDVHERRTHLPPSPLSVNSFVSADSDSNTPIATSAPYPRPKNPPPSLAINEHPTTYGGFPIPSISTTAPDSPLTPPVTARPAAVHRHSSPYFPTVERVPPSSMSRNSLQAPHTYKHDIDSTGESADESSDGGDTDASNISDYTHVSQTSLSASPNPSLERLAYGATTPTTDPNTPSPKSRIPRSKQVIMRPAYKRYLIATPPPVLVIHLKRFQQTHKSPLMSFSSSGLKKLDDYVAFPEQLDLAPFLAPKKEDFGLGKRSRARVGIGARGRVEERCMYRLYAVVVHIGNMLGGHYVSYVALPSPPPSSPGSATSEPDKLSSPMRQWSYISDTVVRVVTLEEVLKAKAYICMYERV